MSVRWLFVGSLIVWLSSTAPQMLVISWLNSWSILIPLLLAALLSPVLLVVVMRELQADQSRSRWYWMQYLGMGALLLPIVVIGLLLRVFFSAPIVGLLALVAWAVLIPIAWRKAHTIHNKHLSIESSKLNTAVRIVHISDVHVGSRTAKYLEKVVSQVLSHEPDIVVITGDLLDQSTVGTEQLSGLSRIKCPTLMCLGNHERYVNLDAAINAIESNNVQILRDEATTLGQLRIAGIDDRDRLDALPQVLQNIGKYPEMLGWFSKGDRAMYVSPGAGTWGPIFRLGTRCEMTVIDLIKR